MSDPAKRCQVRGCGSDADTTRFRTDDSPTDVFYVCDWHGSWEIQSLYGILRDTDE